MIAFAITASSAVLPVFAENDLSTSDSFNVLSSDIADCTESQEPHSQMIIPGDEIETDRVCGENMTWHYDITSNVLTIEDYGEMEDYVGEYGSPWESVQKYISKVESNTEKLVSC